MTNTKLIDGFIWLLVNDRAKDLYSCGAFDLYALHLDGSESLIESYADINDAQEYGLDIAIEVCHLLDITE